MEVLKAILAALVGLLVIFACIAWAIAAVLGPLAIIKLCALCLLGRKEPGYEVEQVCETSQE